MLCSALLASSTLIACASTEGQSNDMVTSTESLMPLIALKPQEADLDPFQEHRPEEIDCNSLSGWYLEDNLLEANTAECNYLSLTESAATTAHAGDTLVTEISYFDLTAAEAAEAHLALTAGSRVLFQTTIPIPSTADVLHLEIELEEDIQEGVAMGIHLHNHGQNTWNISPIQVEHRGEHAPPK